MDVFFCSIIQKPVEFFVVGAGWLHHKLSRNQICCFFFLGQVLCVCTSESRPSPTHPQHNQLVCVPSGKSYPSILIKRTTLIYLLTIKEQEKYYTLCYNALLFNSF